MRHRRFVLATALAVALPSFAASAQEGEYIGLDVRDICEDVDEANQTFCDTLFSGVVLGFHMARHKEGGEAAVCLPDDAVSTTLRDLYLEFTWDDPRTADKPFRDTLVPAFSKYFPCPEKKGK